MAKKRSIFGRLKRKPVNKKPARKRPIGEYYLEKAGDKSLPLAVALVRLGLEREQAARIFYRHSRNLGSNKKQAEQYAESQLPIFDAFSKLQAASHSTNELGARTAILKKQFREMRITADELLAGMKIEEKKRKRRKDGSN